MKAAFIHVLKGLSDDHSWELFKMKAFGFSIAEEYLHLESVGREIVNKCKGVPLWIIMLGSAMNSESTVEDWPKILDSKMLSLQKAVPSQEWWQSYCDLPPRLKQCFDFCSIYQKDQVMYKDELVKLWTVQGFVQSQGNREIDDTGAEYFDELVARSMFQEVSESERGKALFRMHDLFHDLAQFTMKDEIYTFVSSEGGKSEQFPGSNVRHASLSFPDTNDKPKNTPIAFPRARNLQTLLVDGVVDETNRVIVDLLYQARFLRALILSGTKIVKFPKAIWKMKHLRYLSLVHSKIVKLPKAIGKMKQLMYLNLFHSKIMELPESVTHLNNLHTLNVTSCVKLKRLPTGMGQMVSLRHLEIEDTDSLECLPEGLGRITSLRSLCKFIVGGEGGCQIDELQQLNSLQGSLRIQHLERLSSREEAEKAELQNKPHLRRLVLSMSGSADADSEKMDGVIEGLRPNENLEELKLFWYTGSNLPGWIEEMPRLHKLELYGCPNLEGFLHRLDTFSLRELMIRNCHRIEGIESSSLLFLEKISVIDCSEFFSGGLPHIPNLMTLEICRFRNETLPDGGWEERTSLQTLEIWNCSELKSLPDGLMHLKSLERLEISSCKKLESLPNGLQHLSLLRRLLINGCPLLSERCKGEGGVDWPKISHVSYIEIDKQMIHRRRNPR